MAQAKAPVPWFPDAEFRRESDEVTRLFKEAVAAAREENRRLGIPNVQVDDQGLLTEELPDGTRRILDGSSEKPTTPRRK